MTVNKTNHTLTHNVFTNLCAAAKKSLTRLEELCKKIAGFSPLHKNVPSVIHSACRTHIPPTTNNHVPPACAVDKCRSSLKFFNDFFPNVVVLGGVDTSDGKETLRQLDSLGIKYTTRGFFDGSKLPLEVWSRLRSEVDECTRLAVVNKERNQEPLNEQEKETRKRLIGTTACFMIHRDVIMTTIKNYRSAQNELQMLMALPDSPEKKIRLEAAQANVNKYSSVFIFEHNARFGYVNGNKIALTSKLKDDLKNTLKSLPADWELLSLFAWELFPAYARMPDDLPVTKSPLVYPGVGMGCKAYAISARMYGDLEEVFNQVTETHASRDFSPIDLLLHYLTRSACKQNPPRRYQLAPVKSMIYRAMAPSFHADPKHSYANRNFPGTDYDKNLPKKASRQELIQAYS